MQLRRLNVEFFDEVLGASLHEDIVRLNTIKIFLGYRVCCSDEYQLFETTRKEVSKWGFEKRDANGEIPGLEEMRWFIRKCLNSGHTSPIEHVQLTFHVSGFSRTGSHQLVRNRIASYGQQSQRSVSMSNLPVVVPPTIETHENPAVFQRYKDTVQVIEDAYNFFVEQGVPKEDARFITPNGSATALVFTMNFRTLFAFFRERCCNRAQWEIRQLARQMLALCQKYYPFIFEDSGAKCLEQAFCPEGPLMCKAPQFIGRQPAHVRRRDRLRARKEEMQMLSA